MFATPDLSIHSAFFVLLKAVLMGSIEEELSKLSITEPKTTKVKTSYVSKLKVIRKNCRRLQRQKKLLAHVRRLLHEV